MKHLPILILRGYPCLEEYLCSLGVLNALGGRDGFKVSMNHVLVGYRTADGGARMRARCKPGLHLCSKANTALLGAKVGPKFLEQKP